MNMKYFYDYGIEFALHDNGLGITWFFDKRTPHMRGSFQFTIHLIFVCLWWRVEWAKVSEMLDVDPREWDNVDDMFDDLLSSDEMIDEGMVE